MDSETRNALKKIYRILDCKANCGQAGNPEVGNGLKYYDNVIGMGGNLTEDLTIVDLPASKGFFLGDINNFTNAIAIGDLTPLGVGSADVVIKAGNDASFGAEHDAYFNVGNDASFGAEHDAYFGAGNNAYFNAGNDASFGAEHDAYFNVGNDVYFNAGNDASFGAFYTSNPLPSENIRILFKGTQKRVTIDDVAAGYSIFTADFNSGNVTLPTVANFNFPDDIAAALGGVDLYGLYHNNGALRMRIA